MKKKILLCIGAIAIASGIGFTISQSSVVSADPIYSQDEIRKLVTDMYPGTITEFELEKKNNKTVYEVEIKVENKEYELEIDGDTGKVLKLEEKTIMPKKAVEDGQKVTKTAHVSEEAETNEEPEKEAVKQEANAQQQASATTKTTQESTVNKQPAKVVETKKEENVQPTNVTPQKKTVISAEQAKKIALQNFNGTIKELELDEDDGRLVYEIELINGNREADIEIDAYTGKVLMLEIKTEDDDD